MIKIRHIANDGTETIYRYANADKPVTYNDEVYESAVFKITPPETTSTKIGNATLTISAVDQQWIEKIRKTKKRAFIKFVAIIQYADNEEMVAEPIFDNDFVLTNASWDDISITWNMVFDDKWDIKVPSHLCDSINCPGVL